MYDCHLCLLRAIKFCKGCLKRTALFSDQKGIVHQEYVYIPENATEQGKVCGSVSPGDNLSEGS